MKISKLFSSFEKERLKKDFKASNSQKKLWKKSQ